MFGPNRRDGSFWFAEQDFFRLKGQAAADLRGQGGSDQLRKRLGMYLRLQLRDFLAVRRDWTPSFDGYVVLSLPAGASVIALVGRVNEQPVYSSDFPGEASARQAGIILPGGLTQYVIRFGFEPNRHARKCIIPPFEF